ncbi:cilia- and flagella-associated protein 95 isoform X2 [Pseudophryne corroboree]|uniref:cilia- and flagella-associated protein 95 isoform X2 n=1 Tax=Pseudophryne corroboree TaxID=495146 RepID=UPI003081B171
MAMYVMDSSFKRAQLERKGSLYLRSDHMHYDKPTLVSGWHEERETEPKDYDVNKSPLCKGNFRHSTYRRFGTSDIKDWNTTTEEQLSQIYLKNDYELRDVPKKMVNEDNIDTLNVERLGFQRLDSELCCRTILKIIGKCLMVQHILLTTNSITSIHLLKFQTFQIILQPTRNVIHSLQTQQTTGDMVEIPGKMKVEYMAIIK